jgi:hypothetical protein
VNVAQPHFDTPPLFDGGRDCQLVDIQGLELESPCQRVMHRELGNRPPANVAGIVTAKVRVVVESGPVAAIVVVEANFVLELLVVAFDAPTKLDRIHQVRDGRLGPDVGKPELARCRFALRPFDEQPFLRAAVRQESPLSGVAMSGDVPVPAKAWAMAAGCPRSTPSLRPAPRPRRPSPVRPASLGAPWWCHTQHQQSPVPWALSPQATARFDRGRSATSSGP